MLAALSLALIFIEWISVWRKPLLNDQSYWSKTFEWNACMHLELTDTNLKRTFLVCVSIWGINVRHKWVKGMLTGVHSFVLQVCRWCPCWFAGGQLLLVEKFLSEDKTEPENPVVGSLFSAIMDLEGDYRTEQEYSDLLEKAGFSSIQSKRIDGYNDYDVMLATKLHSTSANSGC